MNPSESQAGAPAIQSSGSRQTPTISTKSLSVLVTGIVMLVGLLRCEQKDIPEMFKIFIGSNSYAVVGWVLAVLFLIGGISFTVILNKLHRGEIDRLAAERDKLQSVLLEKVQK